MRSFAPEAVASWKSAPMAVSRYTHVAYDHFCLTKGKLLQISRIVQSMFVKVFYANNYECHYRVCVPKICRRWINEE